jgi:hypothetical protein
MASTGSSTSLFSEKKTMVYMRGTVEGSQLKYLLLEIANSAPPHLERVKFASHDTEASVTYGTYNVHGDLKGRQLSRHILYKRVVDSIGFGKADISIEDIKDAKPLLLEGTLIDGDRMSREVGINRDIFFYLEECNPLNKVRTIYDAYVVEDDESERLMMAAMKLQERKNWQASGIKIELMDHFYVSIYNPAVSSSQEDLYIVELTSSSFSFTPSRQKSRIEVMKGISKGFTQVHWLE